MSPRAVPRRAELRNKSVLTARLPVDRAPQFEVQETWLGRRRFHGGRCQFGFRWEPEKTQALEKHTPEGSRSFEGRSDAL